VLCGESGEDGATVMDRSHVASERAVVSYAKWITERHPAVTTMASVPNGGGTSAGESSGVAQEVLQVEEGQAWIAIFIVMAAFVLARCTAARPSPHQSAEPRAQVAVIVIRHNDLARSRKRRVEVELNNLDGGVRTPVQKRA
jgi:hypothetical protein